MFAVFGSADPVQVFCSIGYSAWVELREMAATGFVGVKVTQPV